MRATSAKISTHAPRTGSDAARARAHPRGSDFNPRSPHGERRFIKNDRRQRRHISTHAPRTGSDTAEIIFDCAYNISTHAPRTGSDPAPAPPARPPRRFQPTLPARGATNPPDDGALVTRRFQPTLPARGATRNTLLFNSHSKFQPTLPARGATTTSPSAFRFSGISTHAPRTGSDSKLGGVHTRPSNFNPRSPHGERHFRHALQADQRHFNPRSPHGERPVQRHMIMALGKISTHAPRTGSDGCNFNRRESRCDFNPRSPHGERR